MSKIFNISGKDYTVEFTIEASLYNDCTSKTVSLMTKTLLAEEEKNIDSLANSISDIPSTVITLLYAGLLEHHGSEEGDGTITSISDAKNLVKQYIKEYKSNYYTLLTELLSCMDEDGFFELIGLTEMFQTEEKAEVVKKQSKSSTTRKTTK